MAVSANTETRSFETEVKQLLHIVIHSLYSNKEIFLRELISNSSDAIDKLRFAALTKSELYENDNDLKIIVSFDEKAKTITVTDNGIGMNREEVINNIGTIAKSGTKEFLAQLTGDQAKDSSLIGQFGVGFYSTFVIADKVTVKTRLAGLKAEEGVLWSSSGDGDYQIETIEKPQRGTEVTLHVKKGEEDFLSDWRLRSVISKYSDHIGCPVLMKKLQTAEEVTEAEKSEGEKGEGKKEKAQKEEKIELESVNKATALWTLQKGEISDDQYKELYKHISHDFQDPLLWAHNHVEGRQHYISLLYIPGQAPFDMWNQEFKHGLKLYIKRVFVMDDAPQFLPRYLRFVKGIIDSSDLPLNISREILQDNKLVEVIRKSCIKRMLDLLQKTANNDAEKYQKFWQAFGLVLKEGPIEDFENREKVSKLLRFASSHSNEATQNVSLDDYVKRMKEGQDKIYYISASSFNTAKHSPHLEVFRDKGIEVLLLSDRIDEWLVNHVTEYDGKQLQSVTKGELDLSAIEQKKAKEETEQQKDTGKEEDVKKDEQKFESLMKQIKEVLGDKVKEVRSTQRLTTSPACIVADQNDMGLEMQRILQAAGQPSAPTQPIFEINLAHPLLVKLNGETDDERFAQWSQILFEQAVLAEGGQLEDPAEFVNCLNKMLLELAQ